MMGVKDVKSTKMREEPDKPRKRKWDVLDAEKSESIKSDEDSTKFQIGEDESPNSKRLLDALKKAKEHAAQISLSIPSLQQATRNSESLNKTVGSSTGQGVSTESVFTSSEDGDSIKRKIIMGREELFKNIEINDVKNRYTITKSATQIKIKQETGADVTTRGKFYPDRNMATDKDPPLYLHVSAPTRESLDKAIEIIDEMINQPPMTLDNGKRSSPSQGGRDRFAFSENITVDIEPDRTFNVRAKILGPGGAYVKHIQQETGTKVQLKGKGSGYLEPSSNKEAQVPLYISIGGSSQDSVDSAKDLCKDLLNNVRSEHNRLKQQRMVRIQQPVIPPGFMDVHLSMQPLALGQQVTYQGYPQAYTSMAHVVPGAQIQQPYQLGSTITDPNAIQAQYTQYYQYGYGPMAPQSASIEQTQPQTPPSPPPPPPNSP